MPDLRIKTAINNGDLPKDHGRKKEWKDTVSADSDEFRLQLKKMWNFNSLFEKGQRSRK